MTPPRGSDRSRERDARTGRSGDRPRAGSGPAGRGGERRTRSGPGGPGQRDDRRSRRDAPAAGRAPARRIAPPPDPERVVARQPWIVLRPLLAGAPGGEDAALQRLKTYTFELLKWNRGVSNLVSRHDEARLVERHVAESLFPATLLRASGCERFVDLGSGAGLPAIPLAIAGVGAHWTLVESRRNKTLFMRKALQECNLTGVDVVCSRLETLLEESAEGLACDGFTSRATMTVGPTLELAAKAVRPGGRAFLWKGSGLEQEMQDSGPRWSKAWRFEAAHTIASGPNVTAVFVRL